MARKTDKNAYELMPIYWNWLDRALIELLPEKPHLCRLTPPKSPFEHRLGSLRRVASTTLMLPLRRGRIFVASSLNLLVRWNRDRAGFSFHSARENRLDACVGQRQKLLSNACHSRGYP